MEKGFDISVVIPTLDNPEAVEEVVISLNQQTLSPKEIIISDSSSDNRVEEKIKKIDSKIVIRYLRTGKAFPFDRLIGRCRSLFSLKASDPHLEKGRSYPYEATNAGSLLAQHEWLAFLDATTIPKKTWLEDYCKISQNHDFVVIFGVTKYLARSNFQKLLRASTYGRRGHETVPGTLIKKIHFLDSGKIIEGVRSGGDIEWRNRIKSLRYKWITPKEICLTYAVLPNNIIPTLKKFFMYQLQSARLDVQNTVKDIYLGLLLILSAIIIPKWNYIVGWEDSILYMPNVTKIYLIALVIVLLSTLMVNRGLLKNLSNSFLSNMIKTTVFISLCIIVYRWNGVIAGWVEDSVWYVPHITKLFLSLVLLSSVIYRGLYFPLNNEVEKEYLFPIKWIQVGILGLILDFVKAPGYTIGSLVSPFTKVRK